MNNIRVIARLDIKGDNLVKGIHLEGLRVLGRPEEFAEYYYLNGIDELIYQDVVASLYQRNSLHDIISRTANTTFIPLTVGGGIRSLDDIRDVLRAGADKVSLNTAVINNPELIREASLRYGSSTIVVTIEASKQFDGKYLAYTDNGREFTGKNVLEWAQEIESLGAGEILLTSIDREGTGEGFDLDLIDRVANALSIPVVAHGGAGNPAHCAEAVKSGANGLAVASMLHYSKINELGSNSEEDLSLKEGNTEFLKSGRKFKNITITSIREIKEELIKNNIECRL